MSNSTCSSNKNEHITLALNVAVMGLGLLTVALKIIHMQITRRSNRTLLDVYDTQVEIRQRLILPEGENPFLTPISVTNIKDERRTDSTALGGSRRSAVAQLSGASTTHPRAASA